MSSEYDTFIQNILFSMKENSQISFFQKIDFNIYSGQFLNSNFNKSVVQLPNNEYLTEEKNNLHKEFLIGADDIVQDLKKLSNLTPSKTCFNHSQKSTRFNSLEDEKRPNEDDFKRKKVKPFIIIKMPQRKLKGKRHIWVQRKKRGKNKAQTQLPEERKRVNKLSTRKIRSQLKQTRLNLLNENRLLKHKLLVKNYFNFLESFIIQKKPLNAKNNNSQNDQNNPFSTYGSFQMLSRLLYIITNNLLKEDTDLFNYKDNFSDLYDYLKQKQQISKENSQEKDIYNEKISLILSLIQLVNIYRPRTAMLHTNI